jgi:AmmeMemoRadiSam system protein A
MYSAIERQTMMITVREAIRHGIHIGTPIRLDLSEYGAALMENWACFVTLKIDDTLRGCMGSFNTRQSLIENIAHNAHSAAFKDPRFIPIEDEDYAHLNVEIAIINNCEVIKCDSQENLMEQLKPYTDGLILDDGSNSATFLPSVWAQLCTAEEFVTELKTKLGLSAEQWDSSISAQRFSVMTIRSSNASHSI